MYRQSNMMRKQAFHHPTVGIIALHLKELKTEPEGFWYHFMSSRCTSGSSLLHRRSRREVEFFAHKLLESTINSVEICICLRAQSRSDTRTTYSQNIVDFIHRLAKQRQQAIPFQVFRSNGHKIAKPDDTDIRALVESFNLNR